MGIEGFFPVVSQLFGAHHAKVLPIAPRHLIFDINGEWRRLQVRKVGSSATAPSNKPRKRTKLEVSDSEEKEAESQGLCGFLPIDVMHYLDSRFANLVSEGRKSSDKCTIWVTSDDGSIPLPEKSETRLKRSEITRRKLEKHGKHKVTYTDVERVEDNYIVRKDGTFDDEPIITDIFCSSSSRNFRVKFLQWIISRACTFPWRKSDYFEIVFLFEGCTPTRVTPPKFAHPISLGTATDISSLKGIAFPEKKFAEADLLVPSLVPFIAKSKASTPNPDDAFNCNVVVSVIDSDVLALLVAGMLRETFSRKRHESKEPEQKLNIVFARPGGVFIDVNGIAAELYKARVSPEMFLSFCIVSGTDFFPRSHVLYGVGNSMPMQALVALTKHRPFIEFDPRTRKGFVELLAIVVLNKDKSLLWKCPEYRSIEGVRTAYSSVLGRSIPSYAPNASLFELTVHEKRKSTNPDPSLMDLGSVFDVFKSNMDYWMQIFN